MSERGGNRIIVDSLDEIPQFTSEDEEREWWATHDFSERLSEQRYPGWDSLAASLRAPLYAYRAKQVEYPLDIARRHLGFVRPKRPLDRPPRFDVRYEHAVIVIVFSAAAVEAGLNLYLMAPWLRLSRKHRMVLSETPEDVQLPAERKLEAVAKACLELREHPELLRRIADLLARRDNLVLSLPPTGGPHEDDARRVREHYEAAEEFLMTLLIPAIDNRVVD